MKHEGKETLLEECRHGYVTSVGSFAQPKPNRALQRSQAELPLGFLQAPLEHRAQGTSSENSWVCPFLFPEFALK